MQSPPITTAHELLRHDEPGRHELVRGRFRTMSPASPWHGAVAMRIGIRVGAFVEQHGLGLVFAADSGFLLARDPDTVLAPDVAFVRRSRLDNLRACGFFDGAPDFAVEVVGPRESVPATQRKARSWLAHGTRLVWVVDCERQVVTVHRPDDVPAEHGAGATLSGNDVLPGMALAVDELWPD
jgi:Uma2 family endonuclease